MLRNDESRKKSSTFVYVPVWSLQKSSPKNKFENLLPADQTFYLQLPVNLKNLSESLSSESHFEMSRQAAIAVQFAATMDVQNQRDSLKGVQPIVISAELNQRNSAAQAEVKGYVYLLRMSKEVYEKALINKKRTSEWQSFVARGEVTYQITLNPKEYKLLGAINCTVNGTDNVKGNNRQILYNQHCLKDERQYFSDMTESMMDGNVYQGSHFQYFVIDNQGKLQSLQPLELKNIKQKSDNITNISHYQITPENIGIVPDAINRAYNEKRKAEIKENISKRADVTVPPRIKFAQPYDLDLLSNEELKRKIDESNRLLEKIQTEEIRSPLANPVIHIPSQEQREGYQVEAFKKIYEALRESQFGLKTNFLKEIGSYVPDNDYIKEIKSHLENEPNGRAAKAWELTQKYYVDKAISELRSKDNIELFDEIYQWSRENSKINRLKQNLFGQNIKVVTKQVMDKFNDDAKNGKGNPDHPIQKICTALRK